VALVRAVKEFDASLGDHGQPMDEATSPDSDPSNREGTHFYRAGVRVTSPEGHVTYGPVVDFAKKAELDAAEAFRKASGENANLNGLMFPVQRVERVRRDTPNAS
jgi:hypothetical protein